MSLTAAWGKKEELREIRSIPILRDALQIAQQADVSPYQIKVKVVRILSVLAIGIVGAITTLVAVGTGVSEPARLLTTFLMLGFVAVTLASVVALLVVLWSANVYQYIKALDARAREADVIDQVPAMIQTAVTRVGREKSFQQEVASLIVVRLQEVARAVVPQVNISAVSDLLSREPNFGQMVVFAFCKHLDSPEAVAALLEDDLEEQQQKRKTEGLALSKS